MWDQGKEDPQEQQQGEKAGEAMREDSDDKRERGAPGPD
jgi:hypothetical protein